MVVEVAKILNHQYALYISPIGGYTMLMKEYSVARVRW